MRPLADRGFSQFTLEKYSCDRKSGRACFHRDLENEAAGNARRSTKNRRVNPPVRLLTNPVILAGFVFA
jgi:hypothetical protein